MNLWFPGLPRQRLTRGTTSENAASDPKKHMNDESSNPVYQHSTNIVPTFTNTYQHLPTFTNMMFMFMAFHGELSLFHGFFHGFYQDLVHPTGPTRHGRQATVPAAVSARSC